jgi:hypothetical protein
MPRTEKTLDQLEEKLSEMENKNRLDKKSDKYTLECMRAEIQKELSDKADISDIRRMETRLDELIALMQDMISGLRKLDNKQHATETVLGFCKKRIADLEEKTFGKRLDAYMID